MKKRAKSHIKMPLNRHTFGDIPPGIKGVYAFWYRVNDKCVYVGKSNNIKRRLRQHWRGSDIPELRRWIRAFGGHLDICYLPVNYGKLHRVETRLINTLRPETNYETRKLNQQR